MRYVILRRRKLGRTSTKSISRKSECGILSRRNDGSQKKHIDVLFRWGCTSERDGDVTVNTAKAIQQVNDKAGFREVLEEHELCARGVKGPDDMFGPAVVRPRTHSRGRNLWVATTRDEFVAAIKKAGVGWYASDLIDKVAEYRVFVVQGRVVCVARKTPGNPDQVAWNVAQGGRFDNVGWKDWPLKAVKVSVEAFNLTSLDFGGVDVMVDEDGNAYVIEINSAPSLTSDYRQTCFAKAFDYIIRNGKERIPLMREKGGYLKFIHPAISEDAKIGA